MEAHGSTSQEKSAFELHMLRSNERTLSLFHSGEEKNTHILEMNKVVFVKLLF